MTKRKSGRQHSYKMRGCSKTRKHYRTKKRHSGGDATVLSLAYPYKNVPTAINPFLAYNGKGGDKHPLYNPNAKNPIYPNSGPLVKQMDWLNSQVMRGGCGEGGSCSINPPPTPAPIISQAQTGGAVSIGQAGPGGGIGCSTSNNGIKYPDGLVGKPWTPNSDSWSGNKGVLPGAGNHFSYNTYKNDISRQMKDVGPAPPFTGGKRRRTTIKKTTKKRRYKGGSSLLPQDFVNLGRQFQFGLGSAYNGLMGYKAPVNPLPWKEQLIPTHL